MALTDTFVRTVKANGKATKHADGDGMYLLVTPTGKYWRLDYRFLGKRKPWHSAPIPKPPWPKREAAAARRGRCSRTA